MNSPSTYCLTPLHGCYRRQRHAISVAWPHNRQRGECHHGYSAGGMARTTHPVQCSPHAMPWWITSLPYPTHFLGTHQMEKIFTPEHKVSPAGTRLQKPRGTAVLLVGAVLIVRSHCAADACQPIRQLVPCTQPISDNSFNYRSGSAPKLLCTAEHVDSRLQGSTTQHCQPRSHPKGRRYHQQLQASWTPIIYMVQYPTLLPLH
jgi:hypothetical protein